MKLSPQKRRDESSAAMAQTLLCMLGCFSLLALTAAFAADPSWWSSPGTGTQSAVEQSQVVTNAGVVTTNYVPNDYAVVTQGQLKQFTARSVDELNAGLPGGAGPALTNLVYGWKSDYATNNYSNPTNAYAPYKPSDFTAMTVGQLKQIGKMVWSPLVAVGYTNALPSWLATSNAADLSVANIGQLKTVFDFDLALDPDGGGLPIWWELKYFGQTGLDPNASPSGNGLTLLQDYQQGSNPTNYYSQNGSIITPAIAISGGNNQIESPNTFVPQALAVMVKDSNNNPLINAPVTFSAVAPSDGQLATCFGGNGAVSQSVVTDATGVAQIYYSGGSAFNSTNSIQASAGTAVATFTETTHQNIGDVAAPTGITVSPGSVSGQMVLNWTNNATNATYIIVQQSTDNINWVTIAQINDPSVTTYTVNEADPTKSYYFGVIAGKP